MSDEHKCPKCGAERFYIGDGPHRVYLHPETSCLSHQLAAAHVRIAELEEKATAISKAWVSRWQQIEVAAKSLVAMYGFQSQQARDAAVDALASAVAIDYPKEEAIVVSTEMTAAPDPRRFKYFAAECYEGCQHLKYVQLRDGVKALATRCEQSSQGLSAIMPNGAAVYARMADELIALLGHNNNQEQP